MPNLVLSRQRDEKIIVEVPPSVDATLIEITVADIRGGKVRLWTAAPRHVAVNREEIYQAIQREKR